MILSWTHARFPVLIQSTGEIFVTVERLSRLLGVQM